MTGRITREFLDRMRDDPDFLEATPGDASEAVAILDLAISALDHPAALERAHKEHEEACRYLERLVENVAPPPTRPLVGDLIGLCTQVDNLMCWVRERARAEERERCAQWHDERADAIDQSIAPGTGDDARRHRIDAAALRALGPRPSPEAEAPPSFGAPQAYWQAAQMEAVHRAFWNGREQGRAEATTPPAMTPDLLRERVQAWVDDVLSRHEVCGHSETDHIQVEYQNLTDLRALLAASATPPEPAGDGWISWGGNECQPAPNVAVKYRDGHVETNPLSAGFYRWTHDGGPYDVIAYRLSPPSDLAGER